MQGTQAMGNTVASAPRPLGPDVELASEMASRADEAGQAAWELEQRAAELRRVESALRRGLEVLTDEKPVMG